MKNAITALLFTASSISGANAQSVLKVRLTDNRPINIAVDGRYFNKRGTSVTVGDIPPGYHSIRIFAMRYNRWGHSSEEKIYEGRVTTHNGGMTMFTLDPRNGEVYLQDNDMDQENRPQGQPLVNGYTGTYNDRPNTDDRGNNDYNNNQNNNNNEPPAPPPANVNDDLPPASPVASPVAENELPTLTDAKFEKLKTKATAKKTDTEKMRLLKDELKTEKISTNEIGTMMDWFSFESSKTEFAKWAYDSATDKDRYADLLTKLTYKQYQDELDKFIKSK